MPARPAPASARGFRLAIALLVIACVPAAEARAEWLLTPFVGLKFAGSTTFFDPDQGVDNAKLTLGGSLARVDDGLFGFEADFGYSPRFFDTGPGGLTSGGFVVTLMGNVLVSAPPEWTRGGLRPFALGGVGWMRVGIDDVAGPLAGSDLLGMTVGGGATGVLTERTSLRFDLRYLRSVTDDETIPQTREGTRLSFWRATIGISVRLGGN